MLTLDTLNIMLAVSEEGLIEEVVITLLASPQLAAFFEKFPKLKKAMTDDLPRWRENLRQRFRETEVPPELTEEVACYQQCQRLSTSQFIVQLPQTLTLLETSTLRLPARPGRWSRITPPLHPHCIPSSYSAGASAWWFRPQR